MFTNISRSFRFYLRICGVFQYNSDNHQKDSSELCGIRVPTCMGLSKEADQIMLQYYLRLSLDYLRLPLGLSKIISIISDVLWDDLENIGKVRNLPPNITVQFEISL